MSNYNDNSWSDKFSWIITVIAMVLVAILSIGLLCALFIQPQEDEPDEQTVETAYVYSIPDGDDYYYAKDAFLVELDDYWNIKGPSDTFYNDNSKYNAQNIGSCYFYVTVKDNVSGLSETVRLWLVSSVSGVSLSETELEF